MRALVTGAGRGIGRTLMDEGRARGHEMIGTRRAPAAPGWLELDVTDAEAQRAAAAATGPIDLLVCNAGVLLDRHAGLDDLTPEMLTETLAVNVTGLALTIQAQRRNLSAGGRIAIISSLMGVSSRPGGNVLAYRASKAAATNLGVNLAVSLREAGIAVGIYHPGWVRTDMGGAGADISAETSAKGLWDRFEALDLAASGQVQTYDGDPLAF